MLHLTFYARLGAEKKAFDMGAVLNGICEKLIRRHPHIYGDTLAEDEATVKANWGKDQIEGERKDIGAWRGPSIFTGLSESHADSRKGQWNRI